ncbi:hypothetical protein RUM43_004321 [Polyplax serrata]|uniref:methylated diphthine methylhydrolase n=1 Tax=Polyplax serrata TaxID=468196 RepID=A0AAN8XLB0_POLSC
MTSDNFKTLHVYDTVENADTVEWCPIEPYKTSFACGTYHLADEAAANCGDSVKEYLRTGGVTIFTITEKELEVNYKVECPAVLDLKWCGRKLNGKIVLAVANAIGEIVLFHFDDKAILFMSKCVLKKKAGDFLTLSIDWTKQGDDTLMCSSDSKGNVTVIKVENDKLTILQEWNAHSLEAWIVCFDSFHQNIIYSGGDEGLLKVWDRRSEGSSSVATSKKHSAGVTALTSNIHKEYNLVSGSYDETVLFWDTRSWKRPVEEIMASGGIWRLKWEPSNRSRYLLAACVYGGFQIYDTILYKSVSEYKEHKSLAYGADWCHLEDSSIYDPIGNAKSSLVATCSFYDHTLNVSLWREP